REIQGRFPTGNRHLTRDVLGESDSVVRSVLHAQERDRAPQAQESHAVAAFALNLAALLLQRQTVDLHDVVEHAGEHAYDLAVFLPVELRELGERLAHEACQVDGTQQARAVRWQRLFAALTRHDAVEYDSVAVMLCCIKHSLLADVGNPGDPAHETLRFLQRLVLHPVTILRTLFLRDKANFQHEALARLAIDDQLIIRFAGVFLRAALAIGQSSNARLATLQHARKHAEI